MGNEVIAWARPGKANCAGVQLFLLASLSGFHEFQVACNAFSPKRGFVRAIADIEISSFWMAPVQKKPRRAA